MDIPKLRLSAEEVAQEFFGCSKREFLEYVYTLEFHKDPSAIPYEEEEYQKEIGGYESTFKRPVFYRKHIEEHIAKYGKNIKNTQKSENAQKAANVRWMKDPKTKIKEKVHGEWLLLKKHTKNDGYKAGFARKMMDEFAKEKGCPVDPRTIEDWCREWEGKLKNNDKSH